MKKMLFMLYILALIMLCSPIQNANADILGGKWKADFDCYIQTTTYYGNVKNAIIKWNSALDRIGSNIDISVSTSTSSSVTISHTTNTSAAWSGLTILVPYNTASTYSGATVQLNNYYLQKMDDVWKTSTAIHEMGHVLGLDETSNLNYDSVMISNRIKREERGLSDIQTYDVKELDRIY